MGNVGSNSSGRRRSHHNPSNPQAIATYVQPSPQQQPPPPPPPPQPEISGGNRYVFAAATPFPPPQYPTPNAPYYHYPGYYPAPPPPLPAAFPLDLHQNPQPPIPPTWVPGGGPGGRYPHGQMQHVPAPTFIEHQKAVTIRNDVNIKKETLKVQPDDQNPGSFLVSFTFDATVAGSITVVFFAKEGIECNLTPTKESLLHPVTVAFQEGLGQKFIQPSGTGINFLAFDEIELLKEGEMEVYPLAVKAEASPSDDHGSANDGQKTGPANSQITQAIFRKENSEYHVRVVKQILWVGGVRYELQEIYGIGNSVDSEFDGNDPGKECVICLSEPRDTTVLPCRHMCMCSGCAKVLRFQTNRCPICRQPVERLLEIKVNNKPEEQPEERHEGAPAE